MKTLYLIGGTMGVGKTAACRELKKLLPNCVMLDGDWCWDMDPFLVTEETKAMVMDNIRHLLGNFLRCSTIENVVFGWVMHEQSIIEAVLRDLPPCRVVSLSLVCSEAALRSRLQSDIAAGIRQPDILERSAARLPLYAALDTQKLDTTHLTPAEAAQKIAKNNAPFGADKKRMTLDPIGCPYRRIKGHSCSFLLSNILVTSLSTGWTQVFSLTNDKIRIFKEDFLENLCQFLRNFTCTLVSPLCTYILLRRKEKHKMGCSIKKFQNTHAIQRNPGFSPKKH